MTTLLRLSRRGALCLAAVVLLIAGCGGGDDDVADTDDPVAETETAPPAIQTHDGPELPDCAFRLIEVANQDDVKAAARAGQELPDETAAAFDLLETECADGLEALTDEQMTELSTRIDEDVLEYLATGTSQPFEDVGEEIPES